MAGYRDYPRNHVVTKKSHANLILSLWKNWTKMRAFNLIIHSHACTALLTFLWSVHCGVGLTQAAEVNTVYTYQSTISNDASGPLDLKAGLIYNDATVNAPIAVIMHSYSANTTFGEFFPNADRLRDLGFFSILVSMRQRDGSDGVRDSGGLEIYDIFDAVEAVKADPQYAGKINSNNTYITGYSGGGGNTMSALTKFPDYWNAGAAFVGMSDYGYNDPQGWYFNGAGGRTTTLNTDIGVRTTNDPDVIDRYHARASNLASKNNPYAAIYLFSNNNETISPIINDITYRDNAIAVESFPGEFSNITFINGQSGTLYEGAGNPADWVDWNHDGMQQSNELQNYPHSSAVSVQERGERWFLGDLLAGNLPHPVLNEQDELFVAGYVRTKPFQMLLGDGQNAAGNLSYSLDQDEMSFLLEIASIDKQATGELTLYQNRLSSQHALMVLNDQNLGKVDLSSTFTYPQLRDGDLLRFIAVPEPHTVSMFCSGCILIASCTRTHSLTRSTASKQGILGRLLCFKSHRLLPTHDNRCK